MAIHGYYRYPTLFNDTIVFVSEDDLWIVPATGGIARRLTSNLAAITFPVFSPCGEWLAFTGREEGAMEVYVMPAKGGPVKRLTYLGVASATVGWSPDGRILFASDAGQPFDRRMAIHAVSLDGAIEKMPYGLAVSASVTTGNRVAIGRNNSDPARWKRYRGGTAGDLWVDSKGNGEFSKLINLKSNMASPMWLGERIYFISDHEGIGNIYSCTAAGEDLKRHTNKTEHYVRFPNTDGSRIAFQCGGDLFILDPATGSESKVEVEYFSPRVHRQRKFVDAGRYLEGCALHPEGHSLAINTRGKGFVMGNWEGAVTQLHPDADEPIRCRLTKFLNDGLRVVTLKDNGDDDLLEIHKVDGSEAPVVLEGLDVGRPDDIVVSPAADRLALSNHRHEIIVVDLIDKSQIIVERSKFSPVRGIAWSPDGRWLAYAIHETLATCTIKIWDSEDGKTHAVTEPVLEDSDPAFDPDGNYLYFVGKRVLNPVYDNLHFDLGFPTGMALYAIPLRGDVANPFIPGPRAPHDTAGPKPEKPAEGEDKKDEKQKEDKPKPVQIDFDGIVERVVKFPVPEGLYGSLAGLPGKLLFLTASPEGALANEFLSEPAPKGSIQCYDFKELKLEPIVGGVSGFTLSKDLKTMAIKAGKRVRVVAAGAKVEDKPDGDANAPGKKTGWVDLSRIKACVVPAAEWRQMAREAWKLQREYFWTEDMSQIEWDRVWSRYEPLIDRVGTRGEFSDLVWEMQGELGTSHAYEFGGDYRPTPSYPQGFLGAEFAYDEADGGYKVTKVLRGAPGEAKSSSPLQGPGVNVRVGDFVLAINGRKLTKDFTPEKALVDQAGAEVSLTVANAAGKKRQVTVTTLGSEFPALYRNWVEANRKAVHERTGGKVGYVHIPDMGAHGYAEFHRLYLAECSYDAMIIDVRGNRGGHVSALLLEKIARKPIGYDVSRWGQPASYPNSAVPGPKVMLTDQFAGSDGDIVSHSFKLMGLGTLIGMRTWGGVIGIWPRNTLADGSLTSQPEFSFWFKDVGWGVENYGTDPDILVDITPHQHAKGEDPQMDKAIEVILAQLAENPPLKPDFSDRPNLSLPKSLG